MKIIDNKEKTVSISENQVRFSQFVEDSETLECKIVICGFGVNGNNTMLNRETIGTWINTLVNQPLLGKIGISDNGEADFEGHNFYVVTRVADDGTVYRDSRFDTSAMGVFTDVSIETIKGKELIVATAKVWKRYPEFCAVLKKRMSEGTLKSSWEIAVKKSHTRVESGNTVKVIDEGCFIGHTLLASHIPPAYNESQVLEVASQADTHDIVEAIQKDIENIRLEEEEDNLKKDTNLVPEDENATSSTGIDEAALTEWDLKKALRQAIATAMNLEKWDIDIVCHMPVDKVVWVKTWDDESELDVTVFTYEVENDVVIVSEGQPSKLTVSVSQINSVIADMQKKIDEQTAALVESSSTVQTLNTQISDLVPFKEKFEQAERERIESELAEQRKELKDYALKSGHISADEIESSEEIRAFIENVNISAIKDIIADRFMASLSDVKKGDVKAPRAETAQVKANISIDQDVVNPTTFIKNYIGGNK